VLAVALVAINAMLILPYASLDAVHAIIALHRQCSDLQHPYLVRLRHSVFYSRGARTLRATWVVNHLGDVTNSPYRRGAIPFTARNSLRTL